MNLRRGHDGRRINRLAPLEIGLAALVVIGMFFLITIWMGWMPGASRGQAISSQTKALLEQAITASERVQAQVDAFAKDLAALRSQVQELTTSGGQLIKGKVGQLLQRRQSLMARRLKALEMRAQKPKTAPVLLKQLGRLEDRLGSLGQSVSALQQEVAKPDPALPRLRGRLKGMEKRLADLRQSHRALDRLAALESRLEKLENKTAAPAAGPRTDPGLARRLDALQKRLAELSQQANDGGIKQRLAVLEKAVQRLARSGRAGKGGPGANPIEVARLQVRLSAMEARLSKLASRPAGGAGPASPDLSRRLAALEQRVAALSQRPARQAGGANLARRLERVERRLVARATRPREVAQARPPRRPELRRPPKRIVHKVARGQTLYGLARVYGVTVAELRRWNNIYNRPLWTGENLTIFPRR